MIISEFSLLADLCIKERKGKTIKAGIASDIIIRLDRMVPLFTADDIHEKTGDNTRIQLTSGTEFFIKGFRNKVKIYQKQK